MKDSGSRSHASVPKEMEKKMGMTHLLIPLSVGL